MAEDVEVDGERQRRRGQQRGRQVRRGKEVGRKAGGEERVGEAGERRGGGRGRKPAAADGSGQPPRILEIGEMR